MVTINIVKVILIVQLARISFPVWNVCWWGCSSCHIPSLKKFMLLCFGIMHQYNDLCTWLLNCLNVCPCMCVCVCARTCVHACYHTAIPLHSDINKNIRNELFHFTCVKVLQLQCDPALMALHHNVQAQQCSIKYTIMNTMYVHNIYKIPSDPKQQQTAFAEMKSRKKGPVPNHNDYFSNKHNTRVYPLIQR